MLQSEPGNNAFSLGKWQVNPGSGTISQAGLRLHVEPKLMDVLLCLVRRQGQLVSRAELLEHAWPDVVVNEEVVTRAISELRTLLGDTSRNRRYIATVPKRGYRLVARVWSGMGSDTAAVVTPPAIPIIPASDAQPFWRRAAGVVHGTIVVIAYLVLFVIVLATWRDDSYGAYQSAAYCTGTAQTSLREQSVFSLKRLINPAHTGIMPALFR